MRFWFFLNTEGMTWNTWRRNHKFGEIKVAVLVTMLAECWTTLGGMTSESLYSDVNITWICVPCWPWVWCGSAAGEIIISSGYIPLWHLPKVEDFFLSYAKIKIFGDTVKRKRVYPGQSCPVGLSAKREPSCICAVQSGSYLSHVATEHWKCA